jgi:hypothetical protein
MTTFVEHDVKQMKVRNGTRWLHAVRQLSQKIIKPNDRSIFSMTLRLHKPLLDNQHQGASRSLLCKANTIRTCSFTQGHHVQAVRADFHAYLAACRPSVAPIDLFACPE